MSRLRNALARWAPAGVLAAGLIAAVDPGARVERPIDAEATYLLMTESLVADGDFAYRPEDLRRAFERWPEGPEGLRLAARPAGASLDPDAGSVPNLVYAGSPVYSLVTAPWFAAFGRLGLLWANAFGWALAVALFCRRLAPRDRRGRWWCAAFGLASVLIAYLFAAQPQSLLAAAVFAAAVLWLDGRRATAGSPYRAGALAAGALLGLVGAVQPSLLLVLAVVGVDLALSRRSSLRWFATGATATWLLAMALTGAVSGGGFGTSARTFVDEFPYQQQAAAAAETAARTLPGARDLAPFYTPDRGRAHSGRRFATEAWYFLVGRSSGLLVLFPLALVAWLLAARGSAEGPAGRSGWALLVAVLAVASIAIWHRAAAGPGEAGLLGARGFAAVYPLLLLVPRPPGRWLSAAAGVAIALFTLPALVTFAVGGSAPAAGPGARSALAWLPAELTRFHDAERFGFVVAEGAGAVWVMPEGAARLGSEQDLLWLRDDSLSELWAISPRRLDSVRLTARAHGEGRSLRVASSRGSLRVRFDSDDKSAGTPVRLTPVVRMADLGVFASRERFHRWTVDTSGGGMEQGADGSPVSRRFGVLLDLGAPFEVGPATMHRDRLLGGEVVPSAGGSAG